MKTKNTINNKKTKTEDVSIVTKIHMETNPIKKIHLLKYRNRSLKKSINIINITYYILMILISIPIEIGIINMISEISSDSKHIAILGICMMLYYGSSIIMYYATVRNIIERMRDEISDNNYMIEEIKDDDKENKKRILSKLEFNHLFDQIKDF